MADLKLKLACADYDRTRPLKYGLVKPKGIDLEIENDEVHEIFWRMLQYMEFDVSEMSTSNYLTEKSTENPRFIAIPVFLSRVFRHGYIFINKKAGIKTPQDLKGKNIGVPEYSMTALVWIRGILQHEYGVAPSDVEWHMGGGEGARRAGRIKHGIPENVRIHTVPEGKILNNMLADGEIDALLHADVPPCIWEKNPNVERLFPNYREVEQDYYRRTKIFPIMHSVAIKREIYEAHPWVAKSLYDAFVESKNICQKAIEANTGALLYTLPWTVPEYESTVSIMGYDYWAYGVENSRPTLEALTQYAYEQGLATRKFSLEELFAPETYK